jgi:hypothetical protein
VSIGGHQRFGREATIPLAWKAQLRARPSLAHARLGAKYTGPVLVRPLSGPVLVRPLSLLGVCAVAISACGGEVASDSGDGGSESASTSDLPAITGEPPEKATLLFVVRGPASASDGRIEVQTEVVEWFTDTPQHRAGVAGAAEFGEAWSKRQGDSAPPNAALAGEETDAAVELTDIERIPGGLAFDYKLLRGEVPSEDENTSVFIDDTCLVCW